MVGFDRLLAQLVNSNPGPTLDQLIDLLFARQDHATKIFLAIAVRASSCILTDSEIQRITSLRELDRVLEELAESGELSGHQILKFVEMFGLSNRATLVDLVIMRMWHSKNVDIDFTIKILNGEEGQAKKAWTVLTNVGPTNLQLVKVVVDVKNAYRLEAAKLLLTRPTEYDVYETIEATCPELISTVFAAMMKKQKLSIATLVRFAATRKHEPAAKELLARAKNGKLVRTDFDLLSLHLPALHKECETNGWNEVRRTADALVDCLVNAY